MLRHAIELLYDEATESKLVGLLENVRDAGLPSPLLDWAMRPHITLILGVGADGLEQAVEEFAARTPPMPIMLDSICRFPGDEGVVYLGPIVRRSLLETHAAAHAAIGSCYGELDPLYLPERWMAHCTVAVGLDCDQTHAVMEVCAQAEFPIEGTFIAIGIHDVTVDPEFEGWDRMVSNAYRGVAPLAGP